MALSVLPVAEDVVSSVLDEMLKFVTDDGIFMVCARPPTLSQASG